MANRQNFDNYIMSCLKKYEEKHPDIKLSAKKTVQIPIDGCEYCRTEDDLYNIPFYLGVRIENGNLIIDGDNVVNIKIHFCPICGKKL